jgi:hypothetical protein
MKAPILPTNITEKILILIKVIRGNALSLVPRSSAKWGVSVHLRKILFQALCAADIRKSITWTWQEILWLHSVTYRD